MSIIEKTLHAMMTVGKESIYLGSVYTHYTGVLQVIVRKICRRRKVLLCYAMLYYILCVFYTPLKRKYPGY